MCFLKSLFFPPPSHRGEQPRNLTDLVVELAVTFQRLATDTSVIEKSVQKGKKKRNKSPLKSHPHLLIFFKKKNNIYSPSDRFMTYKLQECLVLLLSVRYGLLSLLRLFFPRFSLIFFPPLSPSSQ